jgi:hypothetical protein
VITAHVNELGIVLRIRHADNLSREQWEALLDELKSQHVPALYRIGERCIVDALPGDQGTRMTIYLTPVTVSLGEAVMILEKWHFDVYDVRENPPGQGTRPR